MQKIVIFILTIIILFICCDNTSEPYQNNIYEKLPYKVKINPFLIIDSDQDALTFYGQDTVDCSGFDKPSYTDGKWDLLMMKKYNKHGELLIDETNIITTKAILDYVVFRKKENIYIIWLDPRNNSDFRANQSHTYYTDVYFKIIDNKGNEIRAEEKLTDEIMYYQDAQEYFDLGEIYNGTINDLHYENIVIKIYEYYWNPSISWIIVDSNYDEHHLKIYGAHVTDTSRITYTRFNTDSLIILEEQTIAMFKKIEGEQWGPDIQNMYAKYDGKDNIHIVWQLNDGRNDFIYYYENIDINNMAITLNTVGKKYP